MRKAVAWILIGMSLLALGCSREGGNSVDVAPSISSSKSPRQEAKLSPEEAQVAAQRGVENAKANRYGDAIMELEKAISAGIRTSDVLTEAAHAHSEEGNIDRAKELYTIFFSQQPILIAPSSHPKQFQLLLRMTGQAWQNYTMNKPLYEELKSEKETLDLGTKLIMWRYLDPEIPEALNNAFTSYWSEHKGREVPAVETDIQRSFRVMVDVRTKKYSLQPMVYTIPRKSEDGLVSAILATWPSIISAIGEKDGVVRVEFKPGIISTFGPDDTTWTRAAHALFVATDNFKDAKEIEVVAVSTLTDDYGKQSYREVFHLKATPEATRKIYRGSFSPDRLEKLFKPTYRSNMEK